MSEATVPGPMRRFGRVDLLSDDRLARRAIKGDERAFAAIFDRYHQGLYRYCAAIVGNADDAQDALQNTMVKVLRALPGEQRQIDLKPWLYRIAHNEAVELLRRRRPAEELEPELLAGGAGLAEKAEARERLRRLISDLEQLPERQRGALVMRELAGLDFAEIAAALGTSEGVARQTLYEARLSLRQMDEGREMSCDAVTRALSDADGRVTRRRDIRAHLRDCADCRRFRDELAARRQDLVGLAPLPAVAAAGLLQGVLGGAAGGSAASGAGLAGAVGGGAAKSLGATAAVKSAAAVVAVAAVGVGAADRGGVVDVTPWGGGSQHAQEEKSGGDGQSDSSTQRQSADQGPGSAAAKGGGESPGVGNAAAADAKGGAGAIGRGNPGSVSGAAGDTTSDAAGSEAGGAHPHGHGHEKKHPDAASHGQQAAAGHKAGGKGKGGPRRGGGKPSKPVKPTHPSKPSKQPSQPSGGGGGGAAVIPKAPPAPEPVAAPSLTPSTQSTEPKAPSASTEAGE